MRILGTQQRGKERREAFKHRSKYHEILCRSDYAGIIVSIFAQQIKSKYYDGNRSASIEGIALENFRSPTQSNSSVSDKEVSRQAVFRYFLYDMLQLSQQQNILYTTRSNIRESTYGCAEK